MTSTENIPTPTREPSSLSVRKKTRFSTRSCSSIFLQSLRSNSDQDTPIEQYSCDSTPPVGSTRQIRFPSQSANTAPLSSSSSSPYILRNPSPPPIENLSRADMVGDEMYSKSWFCRVLLKLIHVNNDDIRFLFSRFHNNESIDFVFSQSLSHLNN